MAAIDLADAPRQLGFARTMPDALGSWLAQPQAGRVRGWLTTTGTLYLLGLDDWAAFPVTEGRMSPVLGAEAGWDGIDRQIAQGHWQPQILRRARTLRRGLGDFRPERIVAHSLASAPAQILALHYTVPALVFGAQGAVPADSPDMPGEARILTVLHDRDPLWHDTPAGPGYRRLGRIRRIATGAEPGISHDIESYRSAVAGAVQRGDLPGRWP